jgi:hypothetical protein
MCWEAGVKTIGGLTSAGRSISKDACGSTMPEWVLLYFERCNTRHDAMSREWHIKRNTKFRATLRAAIPATRRRGS